MRRDEQVRRLERRLGDLVRTGQVPGLRYVAVDSTATLLDFSAGFAQLREREMSTETTLMSYSLSKTLTAAAVLLLVERGRLGIDDPVAKYLSWQPYGAEVTVRQLLAHTAGIPNPLPVRWVHPLDEAAAFDEHSELRRVVGRHSGLLARPGTRFVYSNIGYWLLGALIEQLSSDSFTSYLESQVFAPLGLTVNDMSYVIGDPTRHASGYLERLSLINFMRPLLIDPRLVGTSRGRWLEIRPHYVNGAAFGGIVARAQGFATFLQDQLRGQSRLLGERARSLFFEQQRTARGDIPMTLGWHIGTLAAQSYYFKEGGGAGFHSMIRLYKKAGIATVLMVNATTFNVARALDALDEVWVAA